MHIERLRTLDGVKWCTTVKDDREDYAKEVGFYVEDPQEGIVQFYEVELGTLFYGPTYGGIIRVASRLRGQPISDAVITNTVYVCKYWKPPNIEEAASFAEDWQEWKRVEDCEFDKFSDLMVQCVYFTEGDFPRICLNFKRRSGEGSMTVVVRPTGRCAVVGTIETVEEAEDLLEYANEVFMKMQQT